MTPTEELRLLSLVLTNIECGHKAKRSARWLSAANWVVLVAAFVAMFHFAPDFGLVVYVTAGVGCILGVLTAFSVIYSHSIGQWSSLAPYIKVEDVKRRIGELKPDSAKTKSAD